MTRGFVYVLIGKRDEQYIRESMRLVRRVCDYDIIVYADYDVRIEGTEVRYVERIKYDTREENRNSSYYRLTGLLDSPFDTTCYIDNDIYVVHSGFLSGFALAEKYGLCMPMNPRAFVTTTEVDMGDIDVGGDVSEYDRKIAARQIPYATSLIMGVMFYNKKNYPAKRFLADLSTHQYRHASRGQAVLMRAMEETAHYPYALPEQYCACRNMVRPLAIHVGSRKEPKCKDWYNGEYAEAMR